MVFIFIMVRLQFLVRDFYLWAIINGRQDFVMSAK
ncbi:hypothetical protein SBV1_1500009 [Verrucomicrobia bacterium]|nr:hypothetical protein SBV1_1500009 [Verrucomicrobiota bacterium]